jgi:poly-gamma-glutamate capsule biosynthesis protein CapA/YwtB (metallophosphatase superfamily)
MTGQISFVASGDYLQTRRVPNYEDPGSKEVAALLQKADARITNLEIHISNNEGTPGALSGGTHVQTTPDRLEDLIHYGFNLVGIANNHVFDFNYDGLMLTNQYLNQYGILHTGSGKNMYEAEKPVYLDTMAGRVALIAISTPMYKAHLATEQRRNCIGRPGINGLCLKKCI